MRRGCRVNGVDDCPESRPLVRPVPDSTARGFWSGAESPIRQEDDSESGIVFPLERLELLRRIRMGDEHSSQLPQCPHDLDVDQHSALAAKDTGEHCDLLLGEGKRESSLHPEG